MQRRLIMLFVTLLASFPLLAQEAAKQEEGPWSGKATLGYLATSGNTENSTLNIALALGYKVGNWSHEATANTVNSAEANVTTAEAYDLGWKSERRLTDHDFLFGRLSWRKDLFSGYNTQFSQSVGYGRRLIDNDKHKLNGELGFGARQQKLQDGTREDGAILRAGAYYKWHFTDTAEFRQDLTIEAGKDNTYGESVTALAARLVGDLALVASYTIKYNSDVTPGTENTDTYTALSLEYAF